MNILKKYLTKIGAKEFVQLSDEEKDTYRRWEETLSGRKLTDEEVKQFLDVEEEETKAKLIKEITATREDTFLKMKLEFVMKIKVFLNSPEMEKKILETNINNLMQ